jgi:hypothetical protein
MRMVCLAVAALLVAPAGFWTISRRKIGGQIRVKGRGGLPCGLESAQTAPV